MLVTLLSLLCRFGLNHEECNHIQITVLVWSSGIKMLLKEFDLFAIFSLLDAFAKLRKATVSFFVFFCPSAWNKYGSILTDFHEIKRLSISRKSVGQIKLSLKSEKINRYFT